MVNIGKLPGRNNEGVFALLEQSMDKHLVNQKNFARQAKSFVPCSTLESVKYMTVGL